MANKQEYQNSTRTDFLAEKQEKQAKHEQAFTAQESEKQNAIDNVRNNLTFDELHKNSVSSEKSFGVDNTPEQRKILKEYEKRMKEEKSKVTTTPVKEEHQKENTPPSNIAKAYLEAIEASKGAIEGGIKSSESKYTKKSPISPKIQEKMASYQR